MKKATKDFVQAVIGAFAAGLAATQVWLLAQPVDGVAPDPTPVPTPTPVPVPDPIPAPVKTIQIFSTMKPVDGETPWSGDVFNFTAMQGERLWLRFSPTTPMTLDDLFGRVLPLPLSAEVVYLMGTVTTTVPSARGIPVGPYYDVLEPVSQVVPGNQYLMQFLVMHGFSATTAYPFAFGGQKFSLTVHAMSMPELPSLPIYMEIEPYALLKGHALDPNSNVTVQGPVVMAYVDELRRHRVEPIKQAIATPAVVPATGLLDLDTWGASNASFRALVVNDAIASPMVPTYFGPKVTDRPSIMYLQAIEKTSKSLGIQFWTYVWDEPAVTDLPEVLARAQLYKQYAPSMKTMVTTAPSASLAPYIDTFVGVVDQYQKGLGVKANGMYTSCMAHGSCSNSVIGNNTGTPDMCFDQPAAHALAFPLMSWVLGFGQALYYCTNVAYGVTDPFKDQRLFAGNGDGNLFYPGTGNLPWPSLRLKLVELSSNIIEWAVLANAYDTAATQLALKTVISATVVWSKDEAAYHDLKEKLAAICSSGSMATA